MSAIAFALRVGFLSSLVGVGIAAAPAARADHDCECGPPHGDCAPCAPSHHGHAHSHGHHGRHGHPGYAGRSYRRSWSGYSLSRASHPWRFAAYGDPCFVATGRRCCGYRFYEGYGYTRALLYGRRHYPWPSYVRRHGWLSMRDDERTPLVPTVAGGALEAHFAGRYETAAASFQAAVDADPSDAASWIGLAHASFGLQQWDRAAAALRRAASLGALDPSARFDVEAAYLDRAAFDERLSALEARVRFRTFDDDARLVLGYVETGLGRTEEARTDLSVVLRRSPNDPAALALLGRSPTPPVVVAKS